MTRKNILMAVVAIIIAGGLYFWSGLFDAPIDDQENLTQVEDIIENEPNNTGNEVLGNSEAGSYQPYSPEKLALAEDGKVILFFRASWCPTCRTLDSDIRSNLKNIPAGVTILDVDYDNSTDLKRKYGVTYQHTLVQVDENGEQVAKWSNSSTLATLISQIK